MQLIQHSKLMQLLTVLILQTVVLVTQTSTLQSLSKQKLATASNNLAWNMLQIVYSIGSRQNLLTCSTLTTTAAATVLVTGKVAPIRDGNGADADTHADFVHSTLDALVICATAASH